MVRALAVFLGIASLAWCENSLTHEERREGFELLFDGKTMRNWHSIKLGPEAGPWRVRKGILTYENGESWLATDDTYFDFVLRLEYRTGAGSDSGILLRAAPTTSGIMLRIPAANNMSKPEGEWNQVEASLIGRRLAVTWNGKIMPDVNLDDPKYGHVGLQAHAKGAPVEFRNIRIKVLKIGPLFLPKNAD